VRSREMIFSDEIKALGILIRSSLSDSKNSLADCWYSECTAAQFKGLNTLSVTCFRRRV
jgi:hypothetical protein